MSAQIKKLTVRLLVDVFDIRVNKLSGDTRTHSWNSTRYDPVHLTEYPPDQSVGVVRNKRKDRLFVGTVR